LNILLLIMQGGCLTSGPKYPWSIVYVCALPVCTTRVCVCSTRVHHPCVCVLYPTPCEGWKPSISKNNIEETFHKTPDQNTAHFDLFAISLAIIFELFSFLFKRHEYSWLINCWLIDLLIVSTV